MIQELSMQLVSTVEQLRNCERQVQLAKNKSKKTELLIKELETHDASKAMYRSVGRLFVSVTPEEMQKDLKNDMDRMAQESERSAAMKTVLEAKKDQLTKQLNDLAPNP